MFESNYQSISSTSIIHAPKDIEPPHKTQGINQHQLSSGSRLQDSVFGCLAFQLGARICMAVTDAVVRRTWQAQWSGKLGTPSAPCPAVDQISMTTVNNCLLFSRT